MLQQVSENSHLDAVYISAQMGNLLAFNCYLEESATPIVICV